MDDLPVTLRLVGLFLLLAINSFFAAAEVALVSVRRTRMKELAGGGDRRARIVLNLLEAPDRMLSATQLGVTLASLGLGWAGEGTVYSLAEPLFSRFLPPEGEPIGHFISFLAAFLVITYLHMVLGEVVPKNMAMERSERLALSVASSLDLFARATGPFVSIVRGTSQRICRLMGLRMAQGEDGFTAEELKLVVSVSHKEGEHAERQQRMLHGVIDFYDVTVREIMVPRQEMVALPVDAGIDQVVDCIARKRHARVPIYDGSPENVVGIVFAKDIWSFVQQMRRWQMLDRPPPAFKVRSFLQSVEFVPETKMLYEQLEEFQERRYQLAMVVDEFGTVSGLVTLEDALEQIVGEIREEHEAPEALSQSPGETIEVDGITNIRDLAAQYQIDLPYDAGFETLAGFLLSRLGHIPEEGEALEFDGSTFTVTKMDHNRIAGVRIDPPTLDPPSEPGADAPAD